MMSAALYNCLFPLRLAEYFKNGSFVEVIVVSYISPNAISREIKVSLNSSTFFDFWKRA